MSRGSLRIGAVLSIAVFLASLAPPVFAYDKALYDAIFEGYKGDANAVKALLSGRKINVNARGREGGTPLSDACYQGNYEIVQTLLAKGARVNAVDDFGNTPLMLAVGDGEDSLRIMRLLIDKGADLNKVNSNGRTALAVANFNGFGRAASLLTSYKPQAAHDLDPNQHKDIFLNAVKNSGLQDVVARVSADTRSPDELTITVTNSWHYLPYQIRLQKAQTLWKTWAKARTASGSLRSDIDSARISLVDANGNKVGGSRAAGGSLLWVKK